MELEKSWIKFIRSGSVADYLSYVNSCKEKEIIDSTTNTIHHAGSCNKGNGCGGK